MHTPSVDGCVYTTPLLPHVAVACSCHDFHFEVRNVDFVKYSNLKILIMTVFFSSMVKQPVVL